ncbi:MAG: hypothetical protein JWQ21_834 [Herminiimonas sp.]|nr:hypothetical protein [Herminiimonas sp.]
MPRNWSELADSSDGTYAVDDFKQALYQLVVGQCLYARFRRQAVSYRIVSTYRKEFKEAADLMGLTLVFKDEQDYCLVRQDVTKLAAMDIQETRFLLTLRKLYHMRGSVGDLNEHYEATVSIEEFETVFKELTKQDFGKGGGDLRTMLKVARSRGLAMEDIEGVSDGDPQPFAISILPAIADIFSEQAIDRFGASLKASLVGIEPKENDPSKSLD